MLRTSLTLSALCALIGASILSVFNLALSFSLAKKVSKNLHCLLTNANRKSGHAVVVSVVGVHRHSDHLFCHLFWAIVFLVVVKVHFGR